MNSCVVQVNRQEEYKNNICWSYSYEYMYSYGNEYIVIVAI